VPCFAYKKAFLYSEQDLRLHVALDTEKVINPDMKEYFSLLCFTSYAIIYRNAFIDWFTVSSILSSRALSALAYFWLIQLEVSLLQVEASLIQGEAILILLQASTVQCKAGLLQGEASLIHFEARLFQGQAM
jgi:hypothetical protein